MKGLFIFGILRDVKVGVIVLYLRIALLVSKFPLLCDIRGCTLIGRYLADQIRIRMRLDSLRDSASIGSRPF